MREMYLGDGVYAVHDGYSVWLDCRGQSGLSSGPSNTPSICLEPSVLNNLFKWLNEIAGKESE